MKSLAFSVPFCWPLVVRLQKLQTIRLLFIPNYAHGEEIRIIARDSSVKPRHDIECYIGGVKEVFPLQLKDITQEIAQLDGFKTVEECQAKLAELNGVKEGQENGHWGFIIRWAPVTMPTQEVIDAVDRMYRNALVRRCQGCTHYLKMLDWCDAKLDCEAPVCPTLELKGKHKAKPKVRVVPSGLDKFMKART